MRVQAFVPDWPGPKQHAADVVKIIEPHCPTMILNDPLDYFNAQWEKACSWFTADVLLWVMADVTLPERFPEMLAEGLRLLSRRDVAWYAPDIAWTSYIYDKKDLRQVEPEVYEVPNTDSLCFMIRRDLVKAMPYVDPKLSFMWGMDVAAFATARLLSVKTVRDYRFKAGHPNCTGYPIPRAGVEMGALFGTFNTRLRAACRQVEDDVRRLRKPPCTINE